MYLQPNLCTVCDCFLSFGVKPVRVARAVKYVETSSTRILNHNINNNKTNAVGTHTGPPG